METPTLQAVLPVARCKMGYLAELEEYDTEKPFFSNVPFFNIPGAKQHNIVTSYHDDVPLTDLRGQEDLVSLDTHGFALRKKDKVYPENLFHDEKWITSHYYEEIGEFVKKELGANRVVIFDHTVRRADPDLPMYKRGGLGRRQPSKMAHVDQTSESAVKRVKYHMKDEAAELLRGHFQIVNLWHPLFGPIQHSPLVLCDYFSVDKDKDLRASDLVFPHYVGEQWYSHYNPQHRWFYLSDQQPQECWLFKCHDSEGGPRKAAFAIHNSVDAPQIAPEGLPPPRPRESIEFRCLVFH